jgi:RHS repeat-associated protein
VTGPTGCQTKYKHNDEGLLSGIVDPNGYETNYQYDKRGRVISRSIVGIGETKYDYDFTALSGTGQYTRIVTDALGNKTSEVYDNVHRLVSSTSPMGRVTSTDRSLDTGVHTSFVNGLVEGSETYDAAGNLASSSDASGLKTMYTYDLFGNLTSATFPNGFTSKRIWGIPGSEFDETGAKRRIQIEIDEYGRETKHSYNAFGQRIKTIDFHGGETKFEYDELGNLIRKSDSLGRKWSGKYDEAGNMIEATDSSDQVVKIQYDARNRPVHSTDYLGNVTKTAYDGNGNKVVRIDALGNRWEWTYNVWDKQEAAKTPLGFVTRNIYDKLGQLVSTIDPLGNENKTEYDADGQIIASYDALGNKTAFEYNPDGRRTANVDALGNRSKILYDDKGRPVCSIDPLGNSITVEYDNFGRLIKQSDAMNNFTTTLFDPLGRQVGIIDPFGNRSEKLYDSIGRAYGKVDALGDRSVNIYNDRGALLKRIDALGRETVYKYAPDGKQIARIDPTGQITTFKQEAIGNKRVLTDALGHKSESVLDPLGHTVSFTNSLGNTVKYEYDSDGRKRSETNELGHVTRFEYDNADRRTGVVDANGNRTSYKYDATGQVLSVTDPNGNSTKYQYDKLGNRITITNPSGDSVRSKWNAVGLEISRTLASGEVFAFDYDPNRNKIAEVGPSGKTTFAYNAGRQLSKVTHADGNEISYNYDAVGRRTGMSNSRGGKVSYGYDAVGRRTFVTNHRGETTRFEYVDADNKSVILHANGTKCAKYFDKLGREIKREEIGKDGNILASFESTYNSAGQRTILVEYDGSITHYNYDAAGQLISEVRSGGKHTWRLQYEYDPVGNRMKKIENVESTAYVYGKANQLIKEIKPNSKSIHFVYDECGRLIEEREGQHVTRRRWNSESRLVAYMPSDAPHESYAYNADGIRVKKVIGNQESYFTWDDQNLVAESNTVGEPIAEWTHASGDWGDLISEHRSGKTHTFAFDPSSSTRLVTDASGVPTSVFINDAFGVERAGEAGIVTPCRYVGAFGYFYDGAGRYYVRARYLDPDRGRWISNDPKGFEGGDWNLYGYTRNQPVTALDPSGLECSGCTTVVYSCVRIFLLGVIAHSFFWFHNPCSPHEDSTCGYGPGGAYRYGARCYPEQYEDVLAINSGTAICNRTECAPNCIAATCSQIRKGDPMFDPAWFGWEFVCWDFTDYSFDTCNCNDSYIGSFSPKKAATIPPSLCTSLPVKTK